MILGRVRRTVRERGLIPPGTRVLAACSGGPDSGALLFALSRLCAELEFELEAASVDHGLRPDAGADVEVARAQAECAGSVFHALRVHVDARGSLQANARGARYAALRELAARIGAQRIAVGHTQDDQAETVLSRLLRGASIAGLSGIEPRRDDGVIRPLIDCPRHEVAEFAARHCPQIARDPSNGDPRFERARLRSALLPALEAENPSLRAHLAELSDDAREIHTALAISAARLLQASQQADGSIDVSCWGAEPSALRRQALRQWLEAALTHEIGRAHMLLAERAISAPAEVWLPRGFALHSHGRGRLWLVAGESNLAAARK